MPTKDLIRTLFYGGGGKAEAFRYADLFVNILAVLTYVVGSYLRHADQPDSYSYVLFRFENILGLILLAEYLARLWVSGNKYRFITQFNTILDLLVVVSLLSPGLINLGFLKILQIAAMLRSIHVYGHIHFRYRVTTRADNIFFKSLNLVLFIFVIAEIVYTTQLTSNDAITTYLDALYFTMMTLTTTGFGDIILVGPLGQLMSIVIMVLGISLFLRLIHAIFQTPSVQQKCPRCSHNNHDLDALHCKMCGNAIRHSG